MNKFTYLTLSIVIVTFSSCCSRHFEEEEVVITHHEEVIVDTVLVDTMLSDTGQYVDELAETSNLIEATYGVQWDFCDCVIKNDSIQKVVEQAEDDADYDAIFLRMDEIDLHCKEMLAMPNTTPEERDKHNRKVRKCLKNAN